MNKKGTTIIELIAAIVILAIIATLAAVLLRTIGIANQSISEEAKANVEATKLIAFLNDFYDEFQPTDYQECITNTNCVILSKSFEYVYDSNSSSVFLDIFDPPMEVTIAFEGNDLVIDGVIYNLEYFSFSGDSQITTTINANDKITVEINFIFLINDKTYNFSKAYTFDKATVPII